MRRTGTYGLSGPITSGMGGGGLIGQGVNQQAMATQMLGRVAEEETQRNIGNQQRETARKAGNSQLGAMAGAQVGMSFGPWGALAGGLIGALAGRLF